MTNNDLQVNGSDSAAKALEQLVIAGDLGRLSPAQRVMYYNQVCVSLGLNPYTRPFDYITVDGKLTLYARKDAAEQLRKLHGISVYRLDKDLVEGVYVVTAYAKDSTGREDIDVGAVNVASLKGESLANAYMKAITKAKRRVTLSITGLGWTDESEVDSIPDAKTVHVDMGTGEIVDSPPPPRPAPPPHRVDLDVEPDQRAGVLEYCANLVLDVQTPAGRVQNYISGLHQDSKDRPMSTEGKTKDDGSKALSQYQYLVVKLDQRYGDNWHGPILSCLCQAPITHETPPGWRVKEVLDWLLKPDENQQKVGFLDSLAQEVVDALGDAGRGVAPDVSDLETVTEIPF